MSDVPELDDELPAWWHDPTLDQCLEFADEFGDPTGKPLKVLAAEVRRLRKQVTALRADWITVAMAARVALSDT